jgi:hypothetical protein
LATRRAILAKTATRAAFSCGTASAATPRSMISHRLLAFFSMVVVIGCAPAAVPDAVDDPSDECALCDGKADEWGAPREGSCEALAMIDVANEASFSELDHDAMLSARAARGIVAARERARFESLAEIDAVPYVGVGMLSRLAGYASTTGRVERCEGEERSEIGIVSDLDDTVIPPVADGSLADAPYPGVAELYRILERGSSGDGATGDITYVTARSPERVADVPAWLEMHDVPIGPIETGVGGAPWIAEAEKVRDIAAVLGRTGAQRFVMFGDDAHRDPEAYRRAIAADPDRIVAALIHRTEEDGAARRFEGLHLYESYPEAAAILVRLGVITEADAWSVHAAATAEGLELSESDFRAMLRAR